MNSSFANISVNMKLALGFGAVLIFTALLALVGWNGLDKLISRTDRIGDITELGNKLTVLRVAPLQYTDDLGAQPLLRRDDRARAHPHHAASAQALPALSGRCPRGGHAVRVAG